MKRKRAWRAGQDQIEKLRVAAQQFIGTRNFHNFTIGRDASDKSNFRHIKSVEVMAFPLSEASFCDHFPRLLIL
jgi:tRNA pseudouridine38-40 synthase